MKTGILFEGGASRTIYSCGVMDRLLDADIMPDYILGVSAGITYATSYISKQKERNLEMLTKYSNDSRYMGFRNLINPKTRLITVWNLHTKESPTNFFRLTRQPSLSLKAKPKLP